MSELLESRLNMEQRGIVNYFVVATFDFYFTCPVPIELIQCLGEERKQVIVDLVQTIYNDEELPPDFVNNIFIPLPKSSKAVRCEDHRTISLINHTAKIVLNL